LIRKLQAAGLQNVEVTSTVSPKAVPQLADCATVLADASVQSLIAKPQMRMPVLVPNLKGLQTAIHHKAREVAVFVSASEGFSNANIRCSVQEGLNRARQVAEKARAEGLAVRGYVSCVFACPFDGPTSPAAVLECTRQLLDMHCYEVSLGDTTGVGVPSDTDKLIRYLIDANIPRERLAGHFHDTYGQAIANMWAAYNLGIRTFDSSVGGLGGCPYAPGAKGNLATEDLVYSLHQAGVKTGVDLPELVKIGDWITRELSIPNSSRAGAALLSKARNSKPAPQPSRTKILKTQWVAQAAGEGLQTHKAGTNLKLTLDRPKNGNALTESTIAYITEAFENAAQDRSVTRIAITGNGKYFCTGMDLGKSSPVAKSATATNEQFTRLTRLFEVIDRAPQVTIACIQGPAFGGGCGLALACDIRLMAAKATLRLSEVRLGLSPATISKYVVRELGIPFAREAMLSARFVTSQELFRLGKVALVIDPAADTSTVLDAYLSRLKACAPRASTLSKDLVRLLGDNDEGGKQAAGIKDIFSEMMAPQSESAFGLAQHQSGVKEVDWDLHALSRQGTKARL
jgi:hydroxymethylglutaryl-CoA lyase